MVETISIDRLEKAGYNPRLELRPGMPEYEKLKTSIEQFGNVEPIVWNRRSGRVVGGHQRLSVLKDMGVTEVPCSIVDLDDEDEKVLNVALNKIKGEWDYDKIQEVLDGFDYETKLLSGFSAEEIAILTERDDDDLLFADDFEDWGKREESGNYVVTLIFENKDIAMEWTEKENLDAGIKKGKSTTIIRMDE